MLEARAIPLPAPAVGERSLEALLAKRRSVRGFSEKPLSLPAIARLLWAAQGVTSAEGGRTAPSAGALYPLAVYVVAGNISGVTEGVHRYRPAAHALEPHFAGHPRHELAAAALGQAPIVAAPATIVIAADYGRTAARYGSRAQRYVHMEAGHVCQNIYLEAARLGLGTVVVGAFDDDRVHEVLRLPETESPLALQPVGVAE